MPTKLTGRLVLLVGVEEDTAAMLDEALRDAGCAVEQVAQAQDARRRLNDPLQKVPDVVVLDLATQRAWQLSLLRWLRRFPETADLPIVALTGEATERDICSALNAGADTYLTRPLRPPVMKACLAGLLRHHLDAADLPESNGHSSLTDDVFGRDKRRPRNTTPVTGEIPPSEWELFKVIEAGIGRSLRGGGPLGLVMIGVNVDEPLGDYAFDELVARVIERVRGLLPRGAALKLFERDVLCAVLPDSEEREVLSLVKRLLAEVKGAPMPVGQSLVTAEASCGIAVVEPPFIASPFRLTERARHALERATERHSCGFWVDYPVPE
jgi:DNA-binding response OmpR family regulator/GGDEF domain-containing protein